VKWRTRNRLPRLDENGVARTRQLREEAERAAEETKRDVEIPLREMRQRNRVSELAQLLIHGGE
jgi:hypothetical protein